MENGKYKTAGIIPAVRGISSEKNKSIGKYTGKIAGVLAACMSF